ncbi:SIS domain-containing protein [bacterium]|nr:SIS domain-containing protein [bacterium]
MDFTQQIDSYFNRLKNAIDALERAEINGVMNLLIEAYQKEQQIFIMGNGGSASTASHFVCDFNKGISLNRAKKFKMISLCDNIPTMMALANDEGYDSIFVEQLKCFLQPGDLVIGISGSGNSENVIQAITYANQNGNTTISLTGYDGGKLKQACQFGIHVDLPDMQITEDIHMILDHMMMKILSATDL